MLPLARLLLLLTTFGPAVDQNPSIEKRAVEIVQQMPASQLSHGLPKEPFKDWFRKAVGSGANITWEINDCGERTGDPSQDLSNLPFCVGAIAKMKDGRTVGVYVAAGKKKGLFPLPKVFFIYVKKGKEYESFQDLADLTTYLKP